MRASLYQPLYKSLSKGALKRSSIKEPRKGPLCWNVPD